MRLVHKAYKNLVSGRMVKNKNFKIRTFSPTVNADKSREIMENRRDGNHISTYLYHFITWI